MKSFPTSSSLSKPGGTKEKLLKLIRSHPACVLALRLDVTMRISDEDIMEGLANSADNLDIDFRERMVPEEIIQEILNLRREARAEAALMSKIRRHNVWIVLIRLPLCASGILVFISLLLWLTTFEYTRAVCALYEFANATCSQARRVLHLSSSMENACGGSVWHNDFCTEWSFQMLQQPQILRRRRGHND